MTHQSLFHATIYLLKFPNKRKGSLIQSATVCFVEVTDKLADCRSEQLRSGVKIRPRTNQRLFLQTITIVNKSAQTMFNISFYRTHVHMGSDHWVAMSLTHYKTFLKPCEDLVKTVNVVNVVKT